MGILDHVVPVLGVVIDPAQRIRVHQVFGIVSQYHAEADSPVPVHAEASSGRSN